MAMYAGPILIDSGVKLGLASGVTLLGPTTGLYDADEFDALDLCCRIDAAVGAVTVFGAILRRYDRRGLLQGTNEYGSGSPSTMSVGSVSRVGLYPKGYFYTAASAQRSDLIFPVHPPPKVDCQVNLTVVTSADVYWELWGYP